MPWFKRRQRLINADTLPGASERYGQAALALHILGDLGYESIGLDHYALADDPLAVAARNKSLHRNFQGYVESESDAVLGFGPSAISHFPGGYAQSISAIGAWRHAAESGALPVARGHALDAEDLRRGAIVQSIMCGLEVDLAPWGGWYLFPDAHAELTPLAAAGIVEITGDALIIPSPMRQFSRLVAMAFDAYTPHSSTPHSRAI